jgi:hypothetical protein
MVHSQRICTGNLGKNILPDGDFGTGASTIKQEDPTRYSPSYIFTTNFPGDGYYAIAKTSGAWPLRPGWISVQDNSPTNDGYMLIVNSDYFPGIFFERTVNDLCANTLYEFSVDIINLIGEGNTGYINPDIEFLLDGKVQTSSGKVPQNNRWNRYGFTFTTPQGKTSVRLTLKNRAAGGKGNDLALDNISFAPCGPSGYEGIDDSRDIFLCKEGKPLKVQPNLSGELGRSVFWETSLDGGINWSEVSSTSNDKFITHNKFEVGRYMYRYTSANDIQDLKNSKCHVTANPLTFNVLPNFFTAKDTLCEGGIYFFGDSLIREKGVFLRTFRSSFNCDSMVQLDLSIIPPTSLNPTFYINHPTCDQKNDGSISLKDVSDGTAPYKLILDGATDSKFSFKNLKAGNYRAVITDRYNCISSNILKLVNPEKFQIEIVDDLDLSFGDKVSVRTKSNYEIAAYTWNSNNILKCQDCPDQELIAYKDGFLEISGVSSNGCKTSNDKKITVKESIHFFFPNIISSSGMESNKRFSVMPYNSAVNSINSFEIYNRWGIKIHVIKEKIVISSENKPISLWDSETLVSQPLGMYIFKLGYTTIDGNEHLTSGNFTLVR